MSAAYTARLLATNTAKLLLHCIVELKSVTSVAERPKRRLARPSNASRVTHAAVDAPRRWCSRRDSRSLSEGNGASTWLGRRWRWWVCGIF